LENKRSHQRAALAEQILSDLKAMVDDLRTDRDHWRSMAETIQRQITDQREHRPWWKRLAG